MIDAALYDCQGETVNTAKLSQSGSSKCPRRRQVAPPDLASARNFTINRREHNETVLCELLDFSDDEVIEAFASGAIS
jgi:hypothetical protein